MSKGSSIPLHSFCTAPTTPSLAAVFRKHPPLPAAVLRNRALRRGSRLGGNAYLARSLQRAQRSSGRRTVAVLVWYCNHTNFLHRNDGASSFGRCGRPESYLHCITYLVSYFVLHTGLVSSFGGCMAQASYFDTARRPVSFLAKKARFVTTSNVRSCHKATSVTRVGVHTRYVEY